MKLLTWFKSLITKRNDNETFEDHFNQQIFHLEECRYFVKRYNCSLDCEPCPWCKNGGKEFDVIEAHKLCKFYHKYFRVPAEMSDKELSWYKSLTQRQRNAYDNLNNQQ